MTDPAFLVSRSMEDFVTWVDTSKIKRKVQRYNDKLVSASRDAACALLRLVAAVEVGLVPLARGTPGGRLAVCLHYAQSCLRPTPCPVQDDFELLQG